MQKIILLVGASGTGKDTLLKEARAHFQDDSKIHFIKRYITRPPDEFEENFYVDDLAFEILKNNGFFISFWYAHNLKYGIPQKAFDHIKEDETAILSISRQRISDFESRYGDKVIVIIVTASPEMIEERLKKRNRENQIQIETRLQRINVPVAAKHLISFDNSQELNLGTKAFIILLEKMIKND